MRELSNIIKIDPIPVTITDEEIASSLVPIVHDRPDILFGPTTYDFDTSYSQLAKIININFINTMKDGSNSSGIPSFRERRDFEAFWPSCGAKGGP